MSVRCSSSSEAAADEGAAAGCRREELARRLAQALERPHPLQPADGGTVQLQAHRADRAGRKVTRAGRRDPAVVLAGNLRGAALALGTGAAAGARESADGGSRAP